MSQGLSKQQQQQPEQQEEILLAPRRTHQSYQPVFLSAEAMDQYISPETVNLKMRLFAGRRSGRKENLEDSRDKEEEESTLNRVSISFPSYSVSLLISCPFHEVLLYADR
ncbi:unnamed protein product [Dibothriocephalus latus]|uniref:Uncharacterized protein n=1 Tax=Dibothriocephalus latus TaxID=60516 RepID=A0A3P7NB93_DIBLA|nr:unnamed protein product [Dibothriocephalus latus]